MVLIDQRPWKWASRFSRKAAMPSFASSEARPNGAMGYEACLNAGRVVAEGSIGVGTGATVGKLLGLPYATKGGLGTASRCLGVVRVGALVVVNAFGDIVDDRTGEILAGTRDPEGRRPFIDTIAHVRAGRMPKGDSLFNTTLGVVATNAALTRPQAGKLAQMAQNGLVKMIRPIHSTFDGDVVFALSTGEARADLNVLGAMAEEAVREAVRRAVFQADGLGRLPTARTIREGTWKN